MQIPNQLKLVDSNNSLCVLISVKYGTEGRETGPAKDKSVLFDLFKAFD